MAGFAVNALNRDNVLRIGGNDFAFKPKQVKYFHNADIINMISRTKRDSGIVVLPSEFSDPEKPEQRQGPEYEAVLSRCIQEGVNNYCAWLNMLVSNEQISLLKDLRRTNNPEDPRLHMSPGMLKHMEELLKYRTNKEDPSAQKIEKIKELEKKLAEQKG